MRDEFTMTEDHVKMLSRLHVDWRSEPYLGAPAVDTKRPYGTGDVLRDIAKIIGIEPTNGEAVRENGDSPHFAKADRERMMQLHREMEYAVQVVLATGSKAPGTYRISVPYNFTSWIRVS